MIWDARSGLRSVQKQPTTYFMKSNDLDECVIRWLSKYADTLLFVKINNSLSN